MRGRVLIIAGSDSGGGAGIQADIKAVTALGAFAMTAVTALTAQNTCGVVEALPVPAAFVDVQIGCVLDDIGTDVFKTGMLDRSDIIGVVARRCRMAPEIPLVLDPVMVAKGGSVLLRTDALSALRAELIPQAFLLTPNLPEAETLLGRPITTVAEMEQACLDLRALGARSVLLKGGHMKGDVLTDVLATDDGIHHFSDTRIDTRHTHGTGCTLASAIAAGLAQGQALPDAVMRARRYLRAAIVRAPGFGRGAGPIDHSVTIDTAWQE